MLSACNSLLIVNEMFLFRRFLVHISAGITTILAEDFCVFPQSLRIVCLGKIITRLFQAMLNPRRRVFLEEADIGLVTCPLCNLNVHCRGHKRLVAPNLFDFNLFMTLLMAPNGWTE
jgi:hypothetical protein